MAKPIAHPHPLRSRSWILTFLLLLACWVGIADGFTPDWSSIPDPFYTLTPATPNNPVLTAADVTGMIAYLVADPFLMRKDGAWYMFFEACWNIGSIACATSQDALHWQYQHLVLSEPFHLSFPCVFEDQGQYYMVPESGADQSVRLYKATAFPDGWVYVTTLISGQAFADPSIFYYHNTWWMFVSLATSDRCFLYYSDTLDHGWQQHPLSPIVVNDRSKARPAGRTVVLAGDKVIRLAQKCDAHYGQAVRAFAVDLLTRTQYSEHEIPESPILQASGGGWNKDGMHHCDPWWVGDHWIVSVDGASNGPWSIGIYQSPIDPTAGLVGSPPECSSGPVRLIAQPDPFRQEVTIACDLPRERQEKAELRIYSTAGRLLRTLPDEGPGQGEVKIRWDGLESGGTPAPAGAYFCRLQAGGRVLTHRIVRVR